MRARFIFLLVVSSGTVLAADKMKIDIPGYSVGRALYQMCEESWMPITKPLDMSQYTLTNEAVTHPIIVTILHYANLQEAKRAFEVSWASRPSAPETVKSPYWDVGHEWRQLPFHKVDMILLKNNNIVGVYDLPSDFSTKEIDVLLHGLADNVARSVAETTSGTNGLSCKIEIPKSTRPHDGRLDAKLILRNTSKDTVRVCTLCQAWRAESNGAFNVRLDPEHWKSDAPTLESSAKAVEAISPGDSTAIPFEIFWQGDANMLVTASYTVEREFAQKLSVWHGTVKAVKLIPRK